MSKFIDRLEKVGMLSPTPMGFGAASRRDDSSLQIMLVGSMGLDELKGDPDLSSAAVDAFLVRLSSLDDDSLGGAALESLKDRLWGAHVAGVESDGAERLKELGCDFIVFEADGTAASVLNDEELGKVIAVGPTLDEDTARAIQDLSIDGVLFLAEGSLLPLTVRKLMDIEGARGLVDKPFLMAAPEDLGPGELEALRNAGVTGLVVELSSAESVARTREAIANLPRRKPRSTPRGASVPHSSTDFEPHVHHEDEEEDGEDGEV